MTSNTLLIAGTDTDAGKTVLTTALVAYWQTYCRDRALGLMKPIQSGVGDLELYQTLFTLDQSPESITPVYFQTPVAPPIAAEQENAIVDLAPVWQELTTLQQSKDRVLVEGLGGLGSPVTRELIVADLARDWQLPTVLVVPIKLGAISQTIANVVLARHYRVPLIGVILNTITPITPKQQEQWAPITLLESLAGVRVLGTLPYLQNPQDLTQLTQAAAGLDLECLFDRFVPAQSSVG
ncbi:dethiobiotin synthase [Roseofilum casamattae]|uniref:ATP-dependent dethiobiotin synthetase BioD n=1 Tax=Roseofilum casamattae BLCC-M143 TaxID=3022442 RepID=A0ABT7C2I1_9CYAN|nr:dethiobiotin synthase [Roseofilum casamattae]MDJ1185654.1 dethiobiotin synthase [Roseofilum casamattae BLCC-M143]